MRRAALAVMALSLALAGCSSVGEALGLSDSRYLRDGAEAFPRDAYDDAYRGIFVRKEKHLRKGLVDISEHDWVESHLNLAADRISVTLPQGPVPGVQASCEVSEYAWVNDKNWTRDSSPERMEKFIRIQLLLDNPHRIVCADGGGANINKLKYVYVVSANDVLLVWDGFVVLYTRYPGLPDADTPNPASR